jgi:probable phosphoglycerate mutase
VELILVRHGEPAWSTNGVSQSDPQLTDRGVKQALLMAERLAHTHLHPDEILVSPAVRSRQTAEPLAAATGLTPTTVPGLGEIRMPDWSGEPEERVEEVFTAARNRLPHEWWDGMPGGETFHAFRDRVARTLLEILGRRGIRPTEIHPHLWNGNGERRRVAIVAHAGTNSVALSFLLGIEPTPWEWERFILGHASLARVRMVPLAGEHVFSLRAFNDRDHLPDALRTR